MSLSSVADPETFVDSIADTCRRLNLCRGTVDGLIRRGEIEVAQVGSRKLVLRKSVGNFLARHAIKPGEAT